MSFERRTPLKAKPRSKGNRAELAVLNILKAFGWTGARRNWMSGGQGGGDIIGGPADVHIEVKHHERCSIWEWIAQAESEARPTDVPCVVFRRNRSGWYACVPFEEYLTLVRMRETA